MQHIVFSLETSEYGIKVDDVREVLKRGVIHPLPNFTDPILGAMPLRKGSVIVVDLHTYLKHDVSRSLSSTQRIIVAKKDKLIMGLLVDDVTGIIDIDEKSIDLTTGMAHHGERLIFLMDLTRIMASLLTRC